MQLDNLLSRRFPVDSGDFKRNFKYTFAMFQLYLSSLWSQHSHLPEGLAYSCSLSWQLSGKVANPKSHQSCFPVTEPERCKKKYRLGLTKFQEISLNSRGFPVFPGGKSNSRSYRHPVIYVQIAEIPMWTWLWGRYHIPQNVFLINITI